MIIKNTDILVRRAEEHKALDHIAQKTYGDIHYIQNGVSEPIKWQGCAISCLATETSIQALMDQEDLDFQNVFVRDLDDGRTEFEVRLDPNDLRIMLTEKFGMDPMLVYIAECIFEGSEEEWSKNWPLRFAESLSDGMNITDEHIDMFWNNVVVPYWSGGDDFEYFPSRFAPGWDDPDYGTCELDEYFDFFDDVLGDKLIEFISTIPVIEEEFVAV
jgi:hypothetical protein